MREEDFLRLKELVNNCNKCNFSTCEQCEISWNDVQKIRNLLDLYNKQKEEIEYYKEELEKESSIWTKIEKGNDYISKDKIREKIKDLEWYGGYIKYRFVYSDYDKEVNKVKIELLKELLEED